MGNSILGSIKNKIDKTHSVLDFQMPVDELTQYIEGNANKVVKRDEHAAIYIGKMTEENNTIYNDETIKGMIYFALKNAAEDEVLHVYIGPMLYEALADKEDKKDILNPQEQTKKIYALAKNVKIKKHQLQIHLLDKNHSELFDALQKDGLQGLSASEPIKVVESDTNSLEIAKLLYSVCQKNPLFKKRLFSLIPPQLEDYLAPNHPLHYYGMIECALRITDAIRGITTQGGFITQKKYDAMILWILSCKTQIVELDIGFSTVGFDAGKKIARRYFKNDMYERLLPKQREKQDFKKNIRNTVLFTAGMIATALGTGSAVYNSMKKTEQEHIKKIEKDIEKDLVSKHLKDTKLGVGFHSMIDYNTYTSDEKKAELLTSTTNRVYSYLTNRYGVPEKNELAVKAIIKNELIKTDERGITAINEVNIDLDRPSAFAYLFIEKHLIPNNIVSLQTLECNLYPYSQLKYYKETFEKMKNIHEKLGILYEKKAIHYSSNLGPEGNIGGFATEMNKITNTYIDTDYGLEYELLIVYPGKNGYTIDDITFKEPIICAKIAGYDDSYPYSLEQGAKISEQILRIWEQTKDR